MQTGVAIVDTGIYRHRDFGSRISVFRDFTSNGKTALMMIADTGHISRES